MVSGTPGQRKAGAAVRILLQALDADRRPKAAAPSAEPQGGVPSGADLDRPGSGHRIMRPFATDPCSRRTRRSTTSPSPSCRGCCPARPGPWPPAGGSGTAWPAPTSTRTCFPRPRAQSCAQGKARRRAEAEAARAAAQGIRIAGLDAPDYPAWLRRSYDPPPVLFARGTLVAGEGPLAVAIVGSRAATPSGLAFARALARDLAAGGRRGRVRPRPRHRHRGPSRAPSTRAAAPWRCSGPALDRLYPEENAALAEAIETRRGDRERVPAGHAPLRGLTSHGATA